ncbi:hypothetical protein BH10PSE2_BH10PSE2_15160 [soil metagenome]
MRRIIVTSVVALLCAAGAAQSQTTQSQTTQAQTSPAQTTPAQTTPAPSAGDIVAGRKAAFDLSAVAFGSLKTASEAATPDPQSLQFGASALGRWAKALPGLFPAGTSATDLPGQTTASPAIWADRADFEAKAAAYAAAADRLSELSGDIAAYKTQLGVVNDTCRSCHSVYRVRPG